MASPSAGEESGDYHQSKERKELAAISRMSASPIRSHSRKIFEPTDKDVLFGRGNGSTMHNHSSNYRELITSHKFEYQKEGQHNNIKREITARIVESVKANGGRFLKPHKGRDGSIKYWFEVDNKKAFVKTMDALRVKKESKNCTSGSGTLMDQVDKGQGVEPNNVSRGDHPENSHLAKNAGIQLQTIMASCAGLDDTSFSELLHFYLPQLEGERGLSSRLSNFIQGAGSTISQTTRNRTVESPAQTSLLNDMPTHNLQALQCNGVHETAAQIAMLIPKIQQSEQKCQGMLQQLEPQASRFRIMLENLMAWQTWYHAQYTAHRRKAVLD